MSIYCYSLPSGEVIEESFSFGKAPRTITLSDGQIAERDFGAEHTSRPAGAGWPLECISTGVPAQQAGELRDFFKKHGENIEVSKKGNPIYTSPAQKKRGLKLRGYVDYDSFS